MRRTTSRWLVLLISLLPLGCGDASRATVFGRVTWNGQPVSQGQIRFQGPQGPAVVGLIQDGSYRLSGERAAPVGRDRVEIDVFVEGERSAAASLVNKDATTKKIRQVAASKYNRESILTAQVEAGKENEFHFDLKP